MQIVAYLFAAMALATVNGIKIATEFKLGEVLERCKYSGEFALHPRDRCKFIRCTFGDEPWVDGEGNYKYFPTVQDCPYGTAVSRSLYRTARAAAAAEAADTTADTASKSAPFKTSVAGVALCSERIYGRYSNGFDQCSVDAPPAFIQQPYGFNNAGYGVQAQAVYGRSNNIQSVYGAFQPQQQPGLFGQGFRGVAGGAGYGPVQQGYGPVQQGYGTAQQGYGTVQQGYGTAQQGSGTAQQGYGTVQQGYGTAQQGYGTVQQGYGTAQQGSGTAQQGYGTEQEEKKQGYGTETESGKW